MFTPECQQLVIDVGALRSVHPQTKEKPGRKPFKDIKVMKDDAAGVEKKTRCRSIARRALTARCLSAFEMVRQSLSVIPGSLAALFPEMTKHRQSAERDNAMKSTFNRRDVLKAGTALTATALFAEPLRAAAPPAEWR